MLFILRPQSPSLKRSATLFLLGTDGKIYALREKEVQPSSRTGGEVLVSRDSVVLCLTGAIAFSSSWNSLVLCLLNKALLFWRASKVIPLVHESLFDGVLAFVRPIKCS